jgi:hypothetical protein
VSMYRCCGRDVHVAWWEARSCVRSTSLHRRVCSTARLGRSPRYLSCVALQLHQLHRRLRVSGRLVDVVSIWKCVPSRSLRSLGRHVVHELHRGVQLPSRVTGLQRHGPGTMLSSRVTSDVSCSTLQQPRLWRGSACVTASRCVDWLWQCPAGSFCPGGTTPIECTDTTVLKPGECCVAVLQYTTPRSCTPPASHQRHRRRLSLSRCCTIRRLQGTSARLAPRIPQACRVPSASSAAAAARRAGTARRATCVPTEGPPMAPSSSALRGRGAMVSEGVLVTVWRWRRTDPAATVYPQCRS